MEKTKEEIYKEYKEKTLKQLYTIYGRICKRNRELQHKKRIIDKAIQKRARSEYTTSNELDKKTLKQLGGIFGRTITSGKDIERRKEIIERVMREKESEELNTL